MVTVHGLDKLRERLVRGIKRADMEASAVRVRHHEAESELFTIEQKLPGIKDLQHSTRQQTHWLLPNLFGIIWRGLFLGALLVAVALIITVAGMITQSERGANAPAVLVLPAMAAAMYLVVFYIRRAIFSAFSAWTPNFEVSTLPIERQTSWARRLHEFEESYVNVEARKFILRCGIAALTFGWLAARIMPMASTVPHPVITTLACTTLVAVLMRPIRLRDFGQEQNGKYVVSKSVFQSAFRRTEAQRNAQGAAALLRDFKEQASQNKASIADKSSITLDLSWVVLNNFYDHIIRIRMTERNVEMLQKEGPKALSALETSLDQVERNLRERRFTAFWKSVEDCLIVQSEIRQFYDAAALVTRIWSRENSGIIDDLRYNDYLKGNMEFIPETKRESVGFRVRIRQIKEQQGRLGYGFDTLRINFDDGTAIEITPEMINGFGARNRADFEFQPELLFKDVPEPTAELDPQCLARLEACMVRYRDALEQADKDYELASMGEMIRTRQTLVQGFERLEDAMRRMAASLAQAVRESQQALERTIQSSAASAADQISSAVATGSAANVQAIGRVEQHIMNLEAIGTSIAART